MSRDSTSLTRAAVAEGVRSAIAGVLFVALEEVEDDKRLIADLGAESIDFMDLIFRLEDVLGKKVTVKRFDGWLRERLARDGSTDVTVAIMTEFALHEAGLADN